MSLQSQSYCIRLSLRVTLHIPGRNTTMSSIATLDLNQLSRL